jgi:two-component system, NarL family, nitrate/nitrite response regulator NarL
MSTGRKITVLLADDHPVVRKGLMSCLCQKPNVKVVGEAADGMEALEKARELKPDIAIMDINMPRMNGLEVTEMLRKECPEVKVLIVSMYNSREYVLRIIQAGARGCVLKEAPPEELLRAIETVNRGEAFFSPELARIALNQCVGGMAQSSPFLQLSRREREVLALIAQGQSNKEIASSLDIGVRTIETHRERIMRKLNVHSVAGLTKIAIVNGLVSLERE